MHTEQLPGTTYDTICECTTRNHDIFDYVWNGKIEPHYPLPAIPTAIDLEYGSIVVIIDTVDKVETKVVI